MFPTSSRDPLYVYHLHRQSFTSVENARNVNPARIAENRGRKWRQRAVEFLRYFGRYSPCECNVTDDCLHATVARKPRNSRRNWVDSTEVGSRRRRLVPN